MASVPFNNLITFSRGSNATLTGSNGLIQWAPNNLLLNSEQFDNANWLKLAAGTGVAPTVTANAGVAPDGTTTADRAQLNRGAGTTASDVSRLFQSVALLPTDVGTLSVWLRSFDGVSTYTVGLTNGSASSTVTVTGAWQRFSLASISSTANAQVRLQGDITQQTADLLVWGAQLELGSAATTYNSTTVKNLLGYSEAFDNAAWTKTRASIVTGAQANPVNGAFNAQKLMEDTSAVSSHRVNSGTVTVATNSVVTVSVYLKAAERTWCRIADGGVTSSGAYVNLATGQFGTIASGVTRSSIVSVGNGWYRASITGVLASNLSQLFIDLADGDNVLTYTGNGNSGIYIYGAQLSDSGSLDPYVPTPAAAPSSTAYYGPRFDYDPVTLAPKGLLVEEARTNSLSYSQEFDNVAWQKNNGTATANSTASPDGTITADTFTASAGFAFHYINRTTPAVLTGAHVYSFYVKKNTSTWIFFTISDASVNYFNLDTGLFGTTSDTCTSTPAGNGWYRITVLRTLAVTAANCGIGVAGSNNNASFTAVGTESIFIWGAQLEAGAFATSYIPTVASTVTRSADVATINGSLFSQWYGQSEGTFIWEYSRVAPPGGGRIFASGVGGSNSYGIWVNTATGSQDQITVRDISGDAVAGALFTVNSNSVNNGAVAYRINDFAWASNGAAPATDSTGVVPALSDQLRFGRAINTDASFINGHIRSIDYIPTRIADFQLQALTELPLVPTLDLDFLNNLYEA